MELKDVISLSDLAKRFSKAKGLQGLGYEWMRQAPGRSANKDQQVGNSLAVRKAIKAFNAANKKGIEVYNAVGYDSTPRKTMVIDKAEVIRLKGFIARSSQSKKKSRKTTAAAFKIVGKVQV
jgi:hypothetical protein